MDVLYSAPDGSSRRGVQAKRLNSGVSGHWPVQEEVMEENYWIRLAQRRAGRRTFLGVAGTAVVGGGAFALVGCGDDSSSSKSGGSTSASGTTAGGGSSSATAVAGISDYP